MISKHYKFNKDNEIRFEYPNGYGKHKKKIVLTVYQCEPVAEVYLDDLNFTLIDVGSLYLLESNPYIAHKRNDGQLCARANGVSRKYLHREILKPSDNLQVDHINHNPLDNRISNLRECSAKQNQIAKRNSRVNEVLDTGHIGVVHYNQNFENESPIYKVRHPVKGVYPKAFSCDWEAAEYRDNMIVDHFFSECNDGEWETINFILWNTNPEHIELIKHDSRYYEHNMKENGQMMYEEGLIWLKKQAWTKTYNEHFVQKYIDEDSDD